METPRHRLGARDRSFRRNSNDDFLCLPRGSQGGGRRKDGTGSTAIDGHVGVWNYRLRSVHRCLTRDLTLDLVLTHRVCTGMRFYEFEPTVESVLDFLRSGGFKQRLDTVKDAKQRYFIKKFLKWNASERHSAQRACTSSIFDSATVSVSQTTTSFARGST